MDRKLAIKIVTAFVILSLVIAVVRSWVARRTIRASPSTIDWTFDPGTGLSKVAARLLTSRGEIVFKFYYRDAPESARRIAQLITEGFYDGLVFHRVIPGFIVQTGDPTNAGGAGGSGHPLKPEINDRVHGLGAVGLAHGKDPLGADSQFYITLAPQPQLDHQFTLIGQVVEGLEVLKKIELGDSIQSAEIIAPRESEILPEDSEDSDAEPTEDPASAS